MLRIAVCLANRWSYDMSYHMCIYEFNDIKDDGFMPEIDYSSKK